MFPSKLGPETVVGNAPCTVTTGTLPLLFRLRLMGGLRRRRGFLCLLGVLVLLRRGFLCLPGVLVLLRRGFLCLPGRLSLLRFFLVLVGRLGFLFLLLVVLLLLRTRRSSDSQGQR